MSDSPCANEWIPLATSILGALLVLSEWLGWSSCQANSISQGLSKFLLDFVQMHKSSPPRLDDAVHGPNGQTG